MAETQGTIADRVANVQLQKRRAAGEIYRRALLGGDVDDQELTRAVVTANAGPSDWSTAANWSGGAVPGGASGQDVYIDDCSVDILYGLDQSGISNALDSLNIDHTYTGKIGHDGAAGCVGDYLQIKTSALNIGQHYGTGSPSGSGRIKVDLGSTACTVTVSNAGTSTDDYKPTVRLLANSASTDVRVRKGKVGVACLAGETSTVGDVTVSYVSQQNSDADIFIGAGVTMTNLVQTGGDVVTQCGVGTAATIYAGTLKTHGSGTVALLWVKGGTCESNSTGTITNLYVTGGTCDFTKSAAARTVTTAKIDPSGIIKYDPSIVTMTNKIQPYSSSGVIQIKAA